MSWTLRATQGRWRALDDEPAGGRGDDTLEEVLLAAVAADDALLLLLLLSPLEGLVGSGCTVPAGMGICFKKGDTRQNET